MKNRTFVLRYFNSIKVQLSRSSWTGFSCFCEFQFHKGTIKPLLSVNESMMILYFNSIKVQLSPIALGYITSLFPIGFAGAKLRNLIEKMSMGNYIFFMRSATTVVFYGVTTSQRSKQCFGKSGLSVGTTTSTTFCYKKLSVDILSFPSICLSIL